MSRQVRILIEPSDYVLRNVGDLAMMQAATERLSHYLPDVVMQVLTRDPENLTRHCPHAEPLDARGRNLWLALLPPRLSRAPPAGLVTRLRLVMAKLARPLLRGDQAREISRFVRTVRQADALVVTGMGGITDAFPGYAFELLDTIALAIHFGVPVFMAGQGIGPLESRGLRSRGKDVLPKVELIGLREGRSGVGILRELGVAPERIVVTGDDAIEMAFERSAALGDGIGFNLRMADYAGVGADDARRIAEAVRDAARHHGAPVIALPVSRHEGEADEATIARLLPELTSTPRPIEVARDLIDEMKQCRTVVAGSYHAAVFALSMGIPAIGVARSAYYVDKFAGLEGMFGAGFAWVHLNDADAADRLSDCMERMWNEAPDLRRELLRAAQTQIDASHALYRRIAERLIPVTRNA